MNKNTNILSVSALLLALAAIVILPVSAATASAVLTVAGVLAVLMLDYGRTLEPVRARAQIVAFRAPEQSAAEERAA